MNRIGQAIAFAIIASIALAGLARRQPIPVFSVALFCAVMIALVI